MAGNEGETEVSQTDESSEKSERLSKFPLSRVKNIMKLDPDITLASQEAVFLISKATELFVSNISKEACHYTSQGKRKTVQRKDLNNVIDGVDELAFLEGTLDS